ncbi:MAG: 5'/3'-nucleotidase SurE, partial [Thermosynechococcaceae cyanobacterium]
MKLLVGNDDGIFAPGIQTLANTLATAGHEVVVVCPDRERSATGHGLTIHKPLRAEPVHGIFHPNVEAWACSGTPADCIKLALEALLEGAPDLVLSGINQGSNLGTDVLYSGTVSAAMEGAIAGIVSIAVSLTSFTHPDFQPAADFTLTLVQQLATHPLSDPLLLNVNVPACHDLDLGKTIMTRQGVRRYHNIFEQRIDPRGKTYYWLAGEVLEDLDTPLAHPRDPDLMTDVQALRQGYIS